MAFAVMSFEFKCRSCGSSEGSLILDRGVQPLANNLLRPEDLSRPEPKFPLRLALCHSCWLLQIVDLVPAGDLFFEYLYFSSFSDLMLSHAKEAAGRDIRGVSLNRDNLRGESRSNDTEFDTIYHEHVFYFSLTALEPLFARHGLWIFRVERIPIHGGSLRLFACRQGTFPIENSVSELLAEETKKGLASKAYYEQFAE